MQSLPPKLLEVYEWHYRKGSQPKYDELRVIFLAVIQQFGRIFFVLDALDECPLDQRKDLCKFILSIVDTSSSPTINSTSTPTSTKQGIVKLFVTSRKEPDIERAFQQKSIPTIEIEAAKVDSDIKVYVKAQIELRLQDGSLELKNMELKNRILSVLTTKAGGMYVLYSSKEFRGYLTNTIKKHRFLWAEFQLDAICAEISDKGIENALTRVPDTMDDTYERILTMINAKPRPQRDLARKVLIWTAYSRKPLPIHDLAYAISIEMDLKSLEDLNGSIPTEATILNACANLISVDESDNRCARFVHFSVQEFLTGHRSTTLNMGCEVGHRVIAQACMIFLNLCPEHRPSGFRDMLHEYAFDVWPRHLLAGNLNSLQADDQLLTLTLSFFEKGPVLLNSLGEGVYLKFSCPVLVLIFNLPDTQKYCVQQLETKRLKTVHGYGYKHNRKVLSDDKLAIHYATAELDSVPVVRRLCNSGYALNYSYSDPERINPYRLEWLRLPVVYSVQSTYMAKYLIDNGISIEPQWVGQAITDPLEYFAPKDIEIFQLLLERVVDRNGGRLVGVLKAAACDGNMEVIRLLLDKGVEVNAQSQAVGYGEFSSALQAAAYSNQIGAILLLLDNGAEVNAQSGYYGNALQAAVVDGKIEVIRLLLDKGAEVNAQGGYYGNALQAAGYHDKLEAIRLLLDEGAEVNAQGGYYGNALQAAAHRGIIEVTRLLLDKGAEVNALGGYYGNALQAAVRYCYNIGVIQLLLDKGAEVNAQGGYYGNALQAAAVDGKIEVIRLLLDKGADVNAQGGYYGSALQAAISHGKIEVTRLLLDEGADVNAQGGHFGNALQAAGYDGKREVIRLLLGNGADVNAQGGYYGNALQAATRYCGRIKVIRMLLDNGAEVNAEGGYYGNALQAAVYHGRIEIIRLLLENGAEVNAQGGFYGNALQAAGYRGKIEIIQLLLDEGAEINAQGGPSGNALQATVRDGKIDVIRLLLDKGAEVNAQGGYYGNALQAAAYRGNMEVLRLLLDKGAEVNAQGGTYGNALQAAAYQENVHVLRLLFDKGANINAQGGMFGTVLQAAAYSGNIEVIQLLLDEGANINARGGKYGAALEKMLALEPAAGAGHKVPGDVSLLVELVQDHTPIHMGWPNRDDIESMFWKENRCSLDVFRKLLESRGWRREVAQSNTGQEQGKLEPEPEPCRSESKDEGGIKPRIEEGRIKDVSGTGKGTSPELQPSSVEALNETSPGVTIHVWHWKLLGVTFLVILFSTFIEFFYKV